jgi:hypothetical protein
MTNWRQWRIAANGQLCLLAAVVVLFRVQLDCGQDVYQLARFVNQRRGGFLEPRIRMPAEVDDLGGVEGRRDPGCRTVVP